MNTDNNMPPDIVTGPKPQRDLLTPHKVALLTIIKEFCSVKITSRTEKTFETSDGITYTKMDYSNKQNSDFATTVLKLIQTPDILLKELNNIVHTRLNPATCRLFVNRLKEMRRNGIAGMMDYIQSLETLLVDSAPTVPVVQKSSVLGLFVRHMLLAFDKLTFSHVAKLCQKFNSYYDAAFGSFVPSESDMELDNKDLDLDSGSEDDAEEEDTLFASQKQAEFFIAQQSSLLQINESKALSPPELQQKIRDLFKGNPTLTETYFLSYLNSLRVREYCGAVENLTHHFDRNTILPLDPCRLTPATEEVTRIFRYAALNLAILHAKFGHRKESLAALREAIMLAQEVNDNSCLQFGLTWLYKLNPEGSVETLIERSITKAGELNLWFLSSFGIQNLSKMKTFSTASPGSVLESIMKGDTLNCQHSMTDIMGTSFALRAALYIHYGNNVMASLVSQLLLHLNTSDPLHGGTYHIGEGICIALCNLINTYTLQGDFISAAPIFSMLKRMFPPQNEYSNAWKLCEFFVNYDNAINAGNWGDAKKYISNIVIIQPLEAKFRTAHLLMHQGNLTKSHEVIKELLLDYKKRENDPYFHARILLLEASDLVHMSNYSDAIAPLLSCIQLSLVHHMTYMEALALLYVANIQLKLGLPSIAIQLLDSKFITFLAQGSDYDKGCCYMLYARCLIADQSELEKNFTTATNMFDTAIELFHKVKAFHKVKLCLTFLIHLYNKFTMTEKRNCYAHKFTILDQQYPNTNCNTAMFP